MEKTKRERWNIFGEVRNARDSADETERERAFIIRFIIYITSIFIRLLSFLLLFLCFSVRFETVHPNLLFRFELIFE